MSRWLRVLLFAAAVSHILELPAGADVDATGRWHLHLDPGGLDIQVTDDWTQTGTALSTSSGFSGTINPATGVFSTSQPSSTMGFCADDTRSGTVAADGRTLTGTDNIHILGSPTLCMAGIVYPFTGSLCGGGLLDAGEECDDGNTAAGDGCSSSCQVEPCFECAGQPAVCTPVAPGTPCSAGGPCEVGECDENGACLGVPDVRVCRGAEKSKLLIVDAGGARNKLVWRWKRGASTDQTELADPTTSATYVLCLFAGTAASVVADVQVGPDAQSWSAIGGSGYRYRDAAGAQGGIRKIVLKGSDVDRAKIVLQGKGANLPEIHPPVDLPITVQLRNTDTDVCWSSTFTAADPNGGGKLDSKAP